MTKRLLLIDDERDFTEITGTLLRFHDFEVETFNDPVQIEATLSRKPYDLIVTDLMMPGMDGFEIIRKVRASKGYERVPLILLSAKVLTDEERKFLLVNEVHVLTKPFEPHGLVEKVRNLL